jgi:hypothetical protein
VSRNAGCTRHPPPEPNPYPAAVDVRWSTGGATQPPLTTRGAPGRGGERRGREDEEEGEGEGEGDERGLHPVGVSATADAALALDAGDEGDLKQAHGRDSDIQVHPRYGGEQAYAGTGSRTRGPHHQAEAPEIAPAGRGVSRTTGTQKAGWLRVCGRAGIDLEEAALAGGPDAVGVDGAGGGVLQAGRVHGTYFPLLVLRVTWRWQASGRSGYRLRRSGCPAAAASPPPARRRSRSPRTSPGPARWRRPRGRRRRSRAASARPR